MMSSVREGNDTAACSRVVANGVQSIAYSPLSSPIVQGSRKNIDIVKINISFLTK